MRLLLDTHVFLWWVGGEKRLPVKLRRAIEDERNECWLSLASCWEMAVKSSLGKLELAQPLARFIPEQLAANGFRLLAVELRHVAAVESLPWHHRDPFDRVLVAQASIEKLTLATVDSDLGAYGVETLP